MWNRWETAQPSPTLPPSGQGGITLVYVGPHEDLVSLL